MSTNSGLPDKYLVPAAILLGLICVAVAMAFGTGVRPAAQGTGGEGAVAADIKKLDAHNSPTIGNPSAPVTIAVWFDYQCPFCKRFDQDALAQVYTNYIQTGKVKMVLMDFQFLGEDSTTAALFARAVWEAYPDKFYTWFQAMMTAQDDEGDQGFGDLASIETLTKTIPGIDVSRIESLMTSKKAQYQADIDADRAEGNSFGVNGTPGTLIGTKVLSGAVPYAQVSAAIEAELKK